jgi:hypothetical protein
MCSRSTSVRSVWVRIALILSARIERRSTIAPAVSELSLALSFRGIISSEARSASSMRSMASLRFWLWWSIARLLPAISESGACLRRARSSSPQSRALCQWLASIAAHAPASAPAGSRGVASAWS